MGLPSHRREAATRLATEDGRRPEKGAAPPSATEPAEATGMLGTPAGAGRRGAVSGEKRMHCSGRREEGRRPGRQARVDHTPYLPPTQTRAATRQSPLVRERGGSPCASLERHWIAV